MHGYCKNWIILYFMSRIVFFNNNKIFNQVYKCYKCSLVTLSKHDFTLYLFYYIELYHTILKILCIHFTIYDLFLGAKMAMGKLQLNGHK